MHTWTQKIRELMCWRIMKLRNIYVTNWSKKRGIPPNVDTSFFTYFKISLCRNAVPR